MTDSALTIRSLTKIYPGGRKALLDLHLTIPPGVFGLLGPNGAGKTTLLECVALEREAEGGEILFRGISAWKCPTQWRRLLGLAPQHFGFLPHLSGRETLELAAELGEIPRRIARERIERLLDAVRLRWAAERRVEGYSRGMRQRLGIAFSLVHDPALWLLDEPTSGLDPEERVAFRELLAHEGARRVTVLSTHIVEDVERCCARMAILHRGRLVWNGEPAHLTRSATGRVWGWEAPASEVDRWAADPRVALIRAEDERLIVRAVCDTPPLADARPLEPTLEDAYLSLLGGLKRAEGEPEDAPPENNGAAAGKEAAS